MAEEIEFPESWGLSEQQEFIIGSMADEPGVWQSAYDFCLQLYDDEAEATMPAPAKLRVLIQRCREILDKHTGVEVVIVGKRGSGWHMTRKSAAKLRILVDPVE
jgi:hypothetical protein